MSYIINNSEGLLFAASSSGYLYLSSSGAFSGSEGEEIFNIESASFYAYADTIDIVSNDYINISASNDINIITSGSFNLTSSGEVHFQTANPTTGLTASLLLNNDTASLTGTNITLNSSNYPSSSLILKAK